MATLETADTQLFRTGPVNASEWVIDTPTNLADGDYVVLVGMIDGVQTVSSWPTDFVEIDVLSTGGAATLAAAYKLITNAAGEPADYTITWGGGERGAGASLRVSGADETTFLDVAISTNTDQSATMTALAVTTNTDDALILALLGRDNASSDGWFTIDTGGWTEAVDIGTGAASGAGVGVGFMTQVTAGSTGDMEATIPPDPPDWATFMVAIRPAAGAGVALLRVENESSQLPETDLSVRGVNRIEGETEQGGETDVSVRGMNKIEGETVNEDETLIRALGLLREETFQESLVESPLSFRDLTRLHNEVSNSPELTLLFRGLVSVESDTLNLLETDVSLRGVSKVESESLSLPEADLTYRGLIQLASEVSQLSESPLSFQDLILVLAESITQEETIQRLRSITREQGETTTPLEETIRALDLLKQEDETETTPETTLNFAGRILRIVTETAQTVETAITDLVSIIVTGTLRKWRDLSARERDLNKNKREYD